MLVSEEKNEKRTLVLVDDNSIFQQEFKLANHVIDNWKI